MKKLAVLLAMVILALSMAGCSNSSSVDRQKTFEIGDKLAENQPTPTDIDYSLERYNLIRRAYWVNGQREKARTVPQPLADVPLGYCVLLTDGGAVVGNFVVDGKVTSLNSFLTPDTGYRNGNEYWMPDVDGSYGENDSGIFFFTPDGKYIEWTGIYLYSDIPFEVENPVIRIGE